MIKKKNIIAVFFFLVVLCSINLFCRVKVSNTLLYYVSSFCIISVSLLFYIKNHSYSKLIYLAPTCYLTWAIIQIINGFFCVDSYWVFNQLLHGIFDVLPIVIIFLFSKPLLFINTLSPLNKFIIICSVALIEWCLPLRSYAFLLVPFYYLYICFYNKIPGIWKWITIICVVIVLSQVDNRSGVVKALSSICVYGLFILPKHIRYFLVNCAHYSFYLIGFVLLWLGLTGRYNIFDSKYFEEKDYSTTFSIDTEKASNKTKHSPDTRTFIYIEAITTAIDYDCLWTGRTPAHGYISPFFATDEPVEPGRDPMERFASEVAHINTFVWLGLIGLVLVTFVYIQGSCLAMMYSNNIYVKCIAVSVAFHWLFGWIENVNEFHLIDLMIFAMLALCYSPNIRKMTDFEFELFFKSLFPSTKNLSLYEKYCIFQYAIVSRIILGKIKKNRKEQ